jgi:NAD(P)-dependent dehydrogenase (short-subunit alcohol dehydrogenase family)
MPKFRKTLPQTSIAEPPPAAPPGEARRWAHAKEKAMKLIGKTALVTGGNSGIGLATARLFAAEGARVAIIGRNAETLEQARRTLGEGAVAEAADVGDVAALSAAVARAARALGGLDIVFANAGISATTKLGETDPAVFEGVIRTNLTGVFFTAQAALPHLRDKGAIILNGSVHAVLGAPGYAAYAASKAGVRAMTRVLASELSPRGIRVNIVTPGAASTPIWDRVAPDAAARATLEARIAANVPLGRIGEAEEVARAVLFLASDDASNLQAAEIVVDGGLTGAPYGAPRLRS